MILMRPAFFFAVFLIPCIETGMSCSGILYVWDEHDLLKKGSDRNGRTSVGTRTAEVLEA